MKPFTSTLGATITINTKLLFAFGFGWTSWVIWPNTAEWWGAGMLSILFGLTALGMAIDALKIMMRIHSQEKTIREYLAQGSAPKSSEMASQDHLTKAGMR